MEIEVGKIELALKYAAQMHINKSWEYRNGALKALTILGITQDQIDKAVEARKAELKAFKENPDGPEPEFMDLAGYIKL